MLGQDGQKLEAATQPTRDVTSATFREDVLMESTRQPVLVDFWAPWCGPCKQLTPVLEKVVAGAEGKVKLVKMNIEEHPGVAGQLGIRSIPAVIAFQKGQPIDGFVGVLPEGQVKDFIKRLVGPLGDPLDDLLAEADAAMTDKRFEEAGDLYAAVLAEDEGRARAIAGLARARLEMGAPDEARQVLALAGPDLAADPAIAAARAAVDLAEQAASLDDLGTLEARLKTEPGDMQARFDYALALAARDRREEAAGALLDIVASDRSWNEDGARKQLIQLFEAWGPMDQATRAGRRRLSALLFR